MELWGRIVVKERAEGGAAEKPEMDPEMEAETGMADVGAGMVEAGVGAEVDEGTEGVGSSRR
mgnify:CR=1 FL=1